MHPVRGGDSPPQQTDNAWSPSSVVLDVPGYHTDRPTVAQLAEDADDTLFSSVTRSSNHLLHVLLPNIPIIHITLDQGPIVSNSLPSMIIVILLTECYLDRPTRYLCDC